MSTRLKIFLKDNLPILLVLSFLVLAVYANSLFNDFLSDDLDAIPGNPIIGSFEFVIRSGLNFVQPLLYFITYKLFGLSPWSFRLLNISFHLGTVLVLYLLIYRMSGQWVAFLTAALFAVHPLLVESVAWISGGNYVRYTFFFLVSLLAYTYREKGKKYQILSLLSFVFALASSDKAIVLPPIFVLFEISSGTLKKNWKSVVPYFILAAIWASSRFIQFYQPRVAFLDNQFHLQNGYDNPFYQIPIAIVSYLKLIFWPATLAFYHSELIFTFQQYLIHLFFFLLYLVCIIVAYKKNRIIFFWLCFLPLSLLLTLTPLRISWIVAERYAYPGTIGIIFIFSYLLIHASKKDWYRTFLVCFSIILVIILGIRTIARNIDWKNQDNLWTATLQSSPSSPVSHNNMADVYSRRGDLVNAEKELKIALQLNNKYADAYANLGTIYLQTKRTEMALESFQKAAELNPALWQAYTNLSSIYFEKKDYPKALEFMDKATKIFPTNPVLYRNVGIIYYNMKDKEKALGAFYKALELQPNDELTRQWIGMVQ